MVGRSKAPDLSLRLADLHCQGHHSPSEAVSGVALVPFCIPFLQPKESRPGGIGSPKRPIKDDFSLLGPMLALLAPLGCRI